MSRTVNIRVSALVIVLACLANSLVSAQSPRMLELQVVTLVDNDQKQPVADAFIFVPPMKMLKDPALEAWLKANARSTEKRLLSLSMRQGELRPRSLIAHTGDALLLTVDSKYALDVAFVNNSPLGYPTKEYPIESAEPAISKVGVVGFDKIRNANLLVSDHVLNRVTDHDGKANFNLLPPNANVPFRVRIVSEDRNEKFQYSSNTLEINLNGDFKFDTAKDMLSHVIYCKRLTK